MDRETPLTVITGPTCCGKTGLAFRIAKDFPVQVISADSMQVYRHMDIATAKPTRLEQCRLRHHLIDICDPDEEFNAGEFVRQASEARSLIEQEGDLPLTVGGTGLYIKAMCYGLSPLPGGSADLRTAFDALISTRGLEYLYRILERLDPAAAQRINPGDPVRITRALEVIFQTGRTISEIHNQHGFREVRQPAKVIAIIPDRQQLYRDIDQRVDMMVENGLIAETEKLLDLGYGVDLKSMKTLAYKHVVAYLSGQISLANALEKIKRDTRHYAKRQLTWLNKNRPDVIAAEPGIALNHLTQWLKES